MPSIIANRKTIFGECRNRSRENAFAQLTKMPAKATRPGILTVLRRSPSQTLPSRRPEDARVETIRPKTI
jgi:hypothetical protein